MKRVLHLNVAFALAVLALFIVPSAAFALGGGVDNSIKSSAKDSFIGGGKGNKILTNSIDAAIVGGNTNIIQSDAPYAFIGGGYDNTNSGGFATLSGGHANTASDVYATVGGGALNTAGNAYATVGGGNVNTASGDIATVSGGQANTASGEEATVGGGYGNIASAYMATVPGGFLNTASGEWSFAAGYQANATSIGSFVWSDGTASLTDNGDESFTVRASGGFVFLTGFSSGAELPAGSGSWASLSDRSAKNDIAPVNPETVLASVAALPMATWSYRSEQGVRHIGPMAQDFHAAFNVGEDDRHIADVDEGGVALAAIQGLNQKLDEKDAEIANLKKQNDTLAQRLDELEQTVNKLAGRN